MMVCETLAAEKMGDELTGVWMKAREYNSAHLREAERSIIESVGSQEGLLKHIETLQLRYSHRTLPSCLRKTQTFVAQLNSFSVLINIFIQSNPQVSALVWGSLALVLELAARHQSALDVIVHIFERFQRALPRFREYLEEFDSGPTSVRLQEAFIAYYAEFIAQSHDAMKFLQAKPIRNFLFGNRIASRFNATATKRLSDIQEKARWVEDEINWAKYLKAKAQHGQLVGQYGQLGEIIRTAISMTSQMSLSLLDQNPPFPRNHSFHFRADVIDKLQRLLITGNQKPEVKTAGLFGLGGVGKTQIALEFTHRFSDAYDAVFWIKAETEAKLRESLCAYGRLLYGSDTSVPQQDAVLVDALQKWLKTAQVKGRPVRWLAVFDNVEDAKLLDNFWLSGGIGSVIITTRSSEASQRLCREVVKVPLFTNAESLEFMLGINRNSNGQNEEELSAVQDISDRLGHLPLALNSVGSYVRSTASSYRTFIQHYQDFDTGMLFNANSDPDGFYEKSIRTTWTMTLSSIGLSAKLLMETLALLDSDGVPIELFYGSSLEDKQENGPSIEFPELEKCVRDRFSSRQALDKAISTLLDGSLIVRSPDSDRLSCHRLVREAVLQSLSPKDLALHFDWALFSLNGCFPFNVEESTVLNYWGKCAIYYPQISALLQIYKRFAAHLRPPVMLCEVIRRCAWYLLETGNFKGARVMLAESRQILEEAINTNNHPGFTPQYMCRLTADLYSTYGSIEYEQNLPGLGRAWYEKSDSHRTKLLEDDIVELCDLESMAIVDGNIALTQLANNEAGPSISTFKLLIDTFHNEFSRGAWAGNLSIAYRINGALSESMKWCRQSSDWTAPEHGEKSLYMATVHFNTACTLLLMNDEEQALQELEKCRNIRQEKSLSHPYLGLTYHKIGSLAAARGDLEHAVTFFRLASSILEKCESCEGAAARSKYHLAMALKGLGDVDEAAKYGGQIVELLGHVVDSVDTRLFGLDYFEQFVLYCHR